MSQVGKYITAPYQGVSQAPPQVRLEEQADALEDCFVPIPQGLIKRPPLQWQANLGGHPGTTDGTFAFIEREGDQDYLFTLTREGGSTVPRLYAMPGLPRGHEPGGYASAPVTVSADALAYLNLGSPSPVTDYSVVTVEDYTFIVNRKATVLRSTATASYRRPEGMIWVRQSAYARTYTVTVTPEGGTPVTASLRTPNGKDAEDARFVDTDVIAQALGNGSYTAVNEATISGALTPGLNAQGYDVGVVGSVIYIAGPNNFTIATSDGQAGEAMLAIKDRVQAFSDLPKKSYGGFTVRIAQQSGSDNDDFFVQYQETAGAGTGVWQEVIGPGASLGFDPKTMPVGLTLEESGWQLRVLQWKPRTCGDELLAPDPDFVGQTLKDLVFWQGRLALLSEQAVTLSSADDPFRLYPKTLITVVDSDPISLISPAPNKSTFRFAALFDERLIVFGDTSQAVVSSQGVTTLDSTRIDVASNYEFAGRVRPEASTGQLYFVAPRGKDYSVIYEMKAGADGDGKYRLRGEDMTAAVPKYVPAGIDRVASCPVNYLMVYGRSGDTQIYPHLFRYAEGQRVQNAWERWHLPLGYVLGGVLFKNTTMYLLCVGGGKAVLAAMDLSPDALDEGSTRILTHLDLRVTEAQVTRTYDPTEETTTVLLPYPPYASTIQLTVRAPGGIGGPILTGSGAEEVPEGFPGEVLSQDESAVVVRGDWTQCPLFLGALYTSRWKLSTIYALSADNQPVRSGRTQLGTLTVDLADTGYLRGIVTPSGREPFTAEFTGYTLNDPDSRYDIAPSAQATFVVPVRSNTEKVSVEFHNDSHFGSKVLGFYWRGNLNQRAGSVR